MKGMDMMLKNMLGIDPEEMREHVTKGVAQAQQYAQQMDARLTRAENALAVLLQQNAEILALLKNDVAQPDPAQSALTFDGEDNAGKQS